MSWHRIYLIAFLGAVSVAPAGLLAQKADDASANRRKCPPLPIPDVLPALDAIVDSAKLLPQLAQFRSGDGLPDLVLSLTTPHGSAATLRVLSGPAGEQADSVSQLVQSGLRASFRLDAPSIRLRLKFKDALRLFVERSELCPPVSLEAQTLRSVTVTTAEPPPAHVRSPKIRLRIGADGGVLGADLLSSSGIPELDADMLRAAQAAKYQPALLDGRRVEVWFERGRVDLVVKGPP